MPFLSLAEKDRWECRLNGLISHRIALIEIANPGLMERIQIEAKQRAIRSLGLEELKAEYLEILREQFTLEVREVQVRGAMTAKVRGVAVEELTKEEYSTNTMYVVDLALIERAMIHQEELLTGEAAGREILQLRAERDRLRDAIWLASSTAQIKILMSGLEAFLGSDPLQAEEQAQGSSRSDQAEIGQSETQNE